MFVRASADGEEIMDSYDMSPTVLKFLLIFNSIKKVNENCFAVNCSV